LVLAALLHPFLIQTLREMLAETVVLDYWLTHAGAAAALLEQQMLLEGGLVVGVLLFLEMLMFPQMANIIFMVVEVGAEKTVRV
jgi:hypothetical protein